MLLEIGLLTLNRFQVNKDMIRKDYTWSATSYPSIRARPKGLREILKWISGRYGNDRPVLVTASGLPDAADVEVSGNVDMVQVKRQYINEAMKGKYNLYILLFP